MDVSHSESPTKSCFEELWFSRHQLNGFNMSTLSLEIPLLILNSVPH